MADKKEITIVKGDTTGFGGRVLLTINCSSEVWDLTQLKAKWILHGLEQVFNDLTQPLEINYTKEQTEAFPLGDDYGILRFENQSGERVTADNTIPVKVINYVSGNAIATDSYTLDLEIKDGDEVVMEVLVEAGVTVEVDSTVTLPTGQSAYVENVGTGNHLKLKFGIPRGEKGDEGPEGPEGPDGKDGTDGKDATINGVNTLTLTATDGLELVQNDSTATVSGLALQTAVNSKLAQKPDGSHDIVENNKITKTYLPDFVLGQLIYAGVFVPTTAVATLTTNGKAKLGTSSNTIILTNDTSAITGYEANEGCFYLCTADGTFAGISFLTGDWLISTGSSWQKVDNTDAVTGIKGDAEGSYRIGNVNITLDNVAPAQSGNSGKVIMTDGTNALWQSLPVSSVTVNGVSVVVNGVAVIPIAQQNGDYGLVKIPATAYGLYINSAGFLMTYSATTADIDSKTSTYRPLVPANLDYALKRGVAYNSLTLTDAEKLSAGLWLGYKETITPVASGASITLADNTIYNDGGSGLSSLTFALPTGQTNRFVSEIDFSSPATATTLSYPNTIVWIDGTDDIQTVGGVKSFVPVASQRYVIMIGYNGTSFYGVAKRS